MKLCSKNYLYKLKIAIKITFDKQWQVRKKLNWLSKRVFTRKI